MLDGMTIEEAEINHMPREPLAFTTEDFLAKIATSKTETKMYHVCRKGKFPVKQTGNRYFYFMGGRHFPIAKSKVVFENM